MRLAVVGDALAFTSFEQICDRGTSPGALLDTPSVQTTLTWAVKPMAGEAFPNAACSLAFSVAHLAPSTQLPLEGSSAALVFGLPRTGNTCSSPGSPGTEHLLLFKE